VAHRSDLDRKTVSQPTRRLPDRWSDVPGRSRASSRLPRLAAELAQRERRNEFARLRSTSHEQAEHIRQTSAPPGAVRLRRAALLARCTTASRIERRTACQAIVIRNIRVCTLWAGLKRPIGLPYQAPLKTPDLHPSLCALFCLCVRRYVCVCLSVCVSVCVSVCLSVCVSLAIV
jgi:hypothetical protein